MLQEPVGSLFYKATCYGICNIKSLTGLFSGQWAFGKIRLDLNRVLGFREVNYWGLGL